MSKSVRAYQHLFEVAAPLKTPSKSYTESNKGGRGLSKRILVVDDEAVVRSVCEAVIRRIGYIPILARDGEDGLRTFEQQPHKIDLVLADISMPKLDGIEMVRRMFELKRHSNVIVMTGYTPEYAIPFDVLRLCAAIQKPFTVKQLTEAIQKCLNAENRHGDVEEPNPEERIIPADD